MTTQSGIGLAVSTVIVAMRTGNALVSVQAANNEVGTATLPGSRELGAGVGAPLHTDGRGD